MSHPTVEEFKRAHDVAVEESLSRRPVQAAYGNLRRIRLYCNATAGDLFLFYRAIYRHFLFTSSALLPKPVIFMRPHDGYPRGIPGQDPGPTTGEAGTHVPVTLPFSQQGHTYFILELARDVGGTVIQFPMRHHNMYCSGFRVLPPGADALTHLWYSFDDPQQEPLPPHLFARVEKSSYPIAYGSIESIEVFDGVLDKIYEEFLSYPLRQAVTFLGKIFKDTWLFIACEGTRFAFAQKLNLKGIKSKSVVNPTSLMAKLVRNWGDSSWLTLLLWLMVLESEKNIVSPAWDMDRFPDLMAEFLEKLKDLRKFEKLIRFKNPYSREFDLDALAGRSLFLLKHDSDLIRKILMRKNGYCKKFLEFYKIEY